MAFFSENVNTWRNHTCPIWNRLWSIKLLINSVTSIRSYRFISTLF